MLEQTLSKNSKKLALKIMTLSISSFLAFIFIAYFSFQNYKTYDQLLSHQSKLTQQVNILNSISYTVENLITFFDFERDQIDSSILLHSEGALDRARINFLALEGENQTLMQKALDGFLEGSKQIKTLSALLAQKKSLLETNNNAINKKRYWINQQIKGQVKRIFLNFQSLLQSIQEMKKQSQEKAGQQKGTVKTYEQDTLNHLYFILGCLSLVILIIHVIAAHFISKPLAHITQRMHSMYKDKTGDASKEIARENGFDDIAHMLQAFRENTIKIEEMQKYLQDTMVKSKKDEEVKNKFFARIGEELRNPLTAIIGYSEMVADSVNDKMDLKKLRQDINQIASAGQNLLHMVDSVLDLTDDDDGNTTNIETFNIRERIQKTLPNLEGVILQNKNKFKVHCPDSNLTMNSDHRKVIKILSHLINNAAKFTKNGQIILKINAGTLGDFEAVCFDIEDTGCGIEAERIPGIFQGFSQDDTFGVLQKKGIRFGLSIVKKFCDDLYGTVSLESTVRTGTKIHVVLPVDYYKAQEHFNKISLDPLSCTV